MSRGRKKELRGCSRAIYSCATEEMEHPPNKNAQAREAIFRLRIHHEEQMIYWRHKQCWIEGNE